MKIVIGSDHSGYDLKCVLVEYLKSRNYLVLDIGTNSKEACDYPDFAFKVAEHVAQKKANFGIMIDGAGIGSAMCANRINGVLAATCNEIFVTYNARQHNNANVMCIGSQVVGIGLAKKLVDIFLETKFEGGRHERRVNKILSYDNLNSNLNLDEKNIITTVTNEVIKLLTEKQVVNFTSNTESIELPKLITEEYVKNNCPEGSELIIKKGTIITALAIDMANKKKIKVIFK